MFDGLDPSCEWQGTAALLEAAKLDCTSMLAAVIEQHRAEIEALCQRFNVARLEVFGSAADGTFDPAHSDIDFLVEYLALQPGEHYEAYFGLIEGLERLFGRRIDLVDATCLRNPYFIEGVNESRTLVYDA